ncbi:Outer membrane protein beta-barrel family protein [Tenacibaculum sp. MAR_2010_89]|uniref:outer membrane beta-barrel family protein n=1 Tax=Tenacibaculum sp. MAR_2010_89 TaxID=1250198 RepID=UPI00089AC773|nr:outer membrane beta-barrel family protein [Tenacibaculum sp. MAR_2010_89]SEE24750.1 Outer membrane protein beta-barrel family protein [Tenacibaculum sp. MAR_2010_89]
MKHLIIVFIFFTSLNSIFSQEQFNISGIVSTQNKEVITIGDVLLISKIDNKIIKYTFINNGKFHLEKVKKGNYFLKVNSLGYFEISKEIKLESNQHLKLEFIEKNNILSEVEITASKKVIENKNGNIIINVAKTRLSKESNTLDLLSKLPRIQIASNKSSIEVIGKGNPLIYIGHQRISIDDLNNLSVSQIEKIEIINNPSSKYEAEGRSLLLITLKKEIQDGMKISVTETTSFKKHFNNYLNASTNFKHQKARFNLNISFNNLKIWESNSADYQIPYKGISSDYLVVAKTNRKQAIIQGSFSYQFNKNNHLSVNSNLRTQKEPFTINTITNINSDIINTKSFNDGNRYFSTSNINYIKSLNNSNEFFFGAQYTFYDQRITNSITNKFNVTPITTTINRLQKFNINTYTLKSNYTKKLKKKKTLEIGTSYTNTSTNSTINTFTNTIKQNYYFTEKNKAAYIQYSNNLSTLKYSLGLRFENNETDGKYSKNSNIIFKKNSTDFFPKLNIAYAINKKKTISLNYSKNITRPNYSSTTSTSAFINPFLEFRGNLHLTPSITNEVSIRYQFNKNSINFNYYHKQNPIFYSFHYDENNNKTLIYPTNLVHEKGVNLEVNIPKKYKLWSSSNTISFHLNTINDTRALNTSLSPYLYYYSNHQFKINKSSSFAFDFWGLTNRKEGIFTRESIFVLNASLHKKLFNSLDFTVSFNDIFNTMEFRETYSLQKLNVKNVFFTDANEIAFSLKYSFGKINKINNTNKNINRNMNRIR